MINFQSKAFSITAPAVWNSLSPVTKSSATITTFKSHLKTELFSAAYDISSAAGTSDLNSRHMTPPINVFFDILQSNEATCGHDNKYKEYLRRVHLLRS